MLDPAKSNAYALDIEYGESQPNTLGFSDATRKKLTASGKFEIASHAIGTKKISEIYRLRSQHPAIDVSMVKLNANLYQLTLANGTLMIGNGSGFAMSARVSPM